MTDIKSGINPLFLRDEELRQGIELIFYAYRDFTAEPDAILAKYRFGRAHPSRGISSSQASPTSSSPATDSAGRITG